MKLSETILESLNDIDEAYLEKSEKEYGWIYRYRKQLTAVLSLAAVLILYLSVMPKAQNMTAGSYTAAPAENARQGESIFDSMEEAEAADAGMPSWIIHLKKEDGSAADEAEVQKVYEILRNEGCDVHAGENGILIIFGDETEIRKYLEQTGYSFELEQQ